MKILIKNKFGLILSEALLSIAMLAVGALVLGSIITNAVSTTTLSKNYMIAQNLATEAIEAVKNIRNTNWLLEPDDKNCWLTLDPNSNCGDQVAADKNYIAEKDGGQWLLGPGGEEDLNLDSYQEGAQKAYRLYIKGGEYVTTAGSSIESIFYRSVKCSSKNDNESATFDVTVQWKEGQKVRSLTRSVTLYNFL